MQRNSICTVASILRYSWAGAKAEQLVVLGECD
jgi:hypothetical protein